MVLSSQLLSPAAAAATWAINLWFRIQGYTAAAIVSYFLFAN
jgi:hypothetical protein